MIASLSGLVQVKSPGAVIVDVGGVGYEVFISVRTFDTLPEIGATCFLFIQTVVREDALSVYGFGQKEEKELFLLLVAVSGIGKKTAQRLCIELAEKVGGLGDGLIEPAAVSGIVAPAASQVLADAASALINLGYPQATAWQALRAIEQRLGEGAADLRVEELIRLGLQSLAAR